MLQKFNTGSIYRYLESWVGQGTLQKTEDFLLYIPTKSTIIFLKTTKSEAIWYGWECRSLRCLVAQKDRVAGIRAL